jgi:fibronectin type 3 domain-containing protein
MIAYRSISRIWILGFEIVVCIIIGVIASNAMAAQATLAWDPNTESDLAGYKVHYGTASGSYTVHTDVHNVTTYTVTGLTAGQTYYFAATAYDTSGNESGYSNPVSYAVPGVNGAPTTPVTPTGLSSALVNTAIAFSTSATDPNGDSLQYRYDWGGGVLSGWGAASQSHSWSAAGQYAVKAQARDSLGLESAWSGAKTVTISPNTQNQAPAAVNAGSDQTVNAAATVSLSGSGTDPENGTLTYQWRQTGGTSVALSNATSAMASFTAPNIATGTATLTFELRVTDEGGLSAVDTLAVVVQSPDIDGDGVPNSQDAFPTNPAEWKDSNGNGIGDNAEGENGAMSYLSIGVYRPSTGKWYLDVDMNGLWSGCGLDGCYSFGANGDWPVAGDWNNDGVSEIAVFRPRTGKWYLDLNANDRLDSCSTDRCLGPFGMSGDLPVAGDWNGDGISQIGVFRPSTGKWYLDLNGNGQLDSCGVDGCFGPFGMSGDLPVAGDWNGDGRAQIGVFRASTGKWYLDLNGNGQWDGCNIDGCYGPFGVSGDLPVAGDWNADGITRIGVFRPSTGKWYLDLNGNGQLDGCGVDGCYGPFGMSGDRPVVGKWY